MRHSTARLTLRSHITCHDNYTRMSNLYLRPSSTYLMVRVASGCKLREKVDETDLLVRRKKKGGTLSIFFYSIYLVSFSLLAKRYAYLFASRTVYVLDLNLPLFLHEPPVIKDNKHIHIYQQRNILSCYK